MYFCEEIAHVAAMFGPVDTKDVRAVERATRLIYEELFPGSDSTIVPRAFGWVADCFAGRFPGYQAIDASYHDLEHTLQGTLCLARLLRNRHLAGVEPVLTPRLFQLGLLAILMHDTGYLKTAQDAEGTGAKYTLIHVARSGEFAGQFLAAKGYSAADIHAVQHMIRCTGVNVDLASIPFADERERILGYALGTADLLGQMAAPDYIEKLPTLYAEFAESAAYSGSGSGPVAQFHSADELMRNTPLFWENYVLPKMEGDFRRLYLFLNDPYPEGRNFYLEQAAANIERLRRHLAVR